MNSRHAFRMTALTTLLMSGASIAPAVGAMLELDLFPSRSVVRGEPEEVVGWGYTLTNHSTSWWLLPTALNSDPFLYGLPMQLFDFPVLTPGSSVIVPFDPAEQTGLYQVSIDRNAPLGFSERGMFRLSAEWWTGDPVEGGQLLNQAEDVSLRWNLQISRVPEPSYLLPLCITLPVLEWIRRKRLITGGVNSERAVCVQATESSRESCRIRSRFRRRATAG
jgi:hypothetical protein